MRSPATPPKAEGTEPAPAAQEAIKTTTKDAVEQTAKLVIRETATESVKESVNAPETKEPAAETKETAEKTNDSTKIEASTGI